MFRPLDDLAEYNRLTQAGAVCQKRSHVKRPFDRRRFAGLGLLLRLGRLPRSVGQAADLVAECLLDVLLQLLLRARDVVGQMGGADVELFGSQVLLDVLGDRVAGRSWPDRFQRRQRLGRARCGLCFAAGPSLSLRPAALCGAIEKLLDLLFRLGSF